jgi:hypothetical protein
MALPKVQYLVQVLETTLCATSRTFATCNKKKSNRRCSRVVKNELRYNIFRSPFYVAKVIKYRNIIRARYEIYSTKKETHIQIILII